MKVFIASDHAGFEMKTMLLSFIADKGIDVVDMGPASYDKEDDYPDLILPCATKVSQSDDAKGIILGGSGQGEAIVANKVKGIRAVVYYGGAQDIITLSREHNNANVLSLGARFLSDEEACSAVKAWLATAFPSEKRHQRRIDKINSIEKDTFK